MKKYATIDVGTNSIRCLLAHYTESGAIEGDKTLEMTRIGEGVNATGVLQSERIESSVAAIDRFVRDAETFGAEAIYMMATSAVRDAANRQVFVDAVYEKTGYELEVISGALEAELGFKGVVAGAANQSGLKLVIDIGGGSTEFIVGDALKKHFSVSIDIGAVRLTNLFGDRYGNMKKYALEKASEVIDTIKGYDLDSVIGIGGTATTFLTMQKQMIVYDRKKVHNQNLLKQEIVVLNQKLQAMTPDERLEVPGLDPKRSDIICAGGVILEAILEAIEQERMTISDFDNLEGYLLYKLEQNRK